MLYILPKVYNKQFSKIQNKIDNVDNNKAIKFESKNYPEVITISDNFCQRNLSTDNSNIYHTHNIPIRDLDVLYNDFAPPERRYPYTYPNTYPIRYSNRYIDNSKKQYSDNYSINIPSRGYPDNYQLVGVLLRNNTETVYNLFGRQKYPGASIYEYYVENANNQNNIKIPISIRGDKEVNDGDTITIPGTNKELGDFIVKLYNYDSPRYIPL